MKVKLPAFSLALFKLQGFIITLILLAIKVGGYAEISWPWVFAAYWIPIALFFSACVIAAVGVFLFFVFMVMLERLKLL